MISVIIPLYNKEKIIERTLQSVLSQNYKDFEVIVVNDGSTDKSATVVKSIDDPRIIFIDQENGGPSKARNTGIKRAKGEWLYFIDADDGMELGALNHFSNLIRRYPDVDMFLGEVFIFDGEKKIIANKYKSGYVKKIFKEYYFKKINQCSGSAIYKQSVCKKFLYNEEIRRFEDLECLFRRYRECTLYKTDFPVATINVEFASASYGRKDISEDFIGHLDFMGKSFWEKMSLYKLYLGERPYYLGQVDKLYPILKYRYDLLLLSKMIDLYANM